MQEARHRPGSMRHMDNAARVLDPPRETVWVKPLPATDGADSLSIHGGVAISSCYPISRSREQFPDKVNEEGRIVDTHIALGNGLTLQVIAVYCPPPGFSDSSSKCEAILALAMERWRSCATGPCIITGDFNREVHTMPTWTALED